MSELLTNSESNKTTPEINGPREEGTSSSVPEEVGLGLERVRSITFSDEDKLLRQAQHRSREQEQLDIFAQACLAAGLDPDKSGVKLDLSRPSTSYYSQPPPVSSSAKPPRKIKANAWDSALLEMKMKVGQMFGQSKMVEEAKREKERLRSDQQLRLCRTMSVGATGPLRPHQRNRSISTTSAGELVILDDKVNHPGWMERTKRKLSESHIVVPPSYTAVWGASGRPAIIMGAGVRGIAGLPSK